MKGSYSKSIYELIGVKIIDKRPDKIYSGKYAGNKFYRLNITCENKPEIKQVNAFIDMVGTFGDIPQSQI
jgi:hypothetical protein